jgi:hypothetical protein
MENPASSSKTSQAPRAAVWPGQWSSDLFEIDDLDEFAKALRIKHDEERTSRRIELA